MPTHRRSSGLILTVLIAPPGPHEIKYPFECKDLTIFSLASRQRGVQVQCK